jgi:predicted RND superfamily exporter protein
LTLARPDWASDVVAKDQRSAKFVFRLPWRPAQDYIPLRHFLNKELALFSDRGLDMKPLGVLFTLLATFGVLVQELLVSFGVAAACISILMVIFLRSVRLGLISLVPNFVPVIMTLGGMALFDIPLDLGTVLFASIVLGICVDDTIHLLHHFQEEFKEHGSVDKAIHQALLYAGKPILITSLLLICCMGVYLFSELGSLQRFGGLMVMSVGWALLADLFLTPIILRWVYAETIDSTINLE